jgi:hypothetical protein
VKPRPASLWAAIALVVAGTGAAQAKSIKPVWSADFERDDAVTKSILGSMENTAEHAAQSTVRRVKDCGKRRNHCVEVELKRPIYDANEALVTKYNVNGEVPLGGYRGESATLAYRVYIAKGTDFRKQGKMPGLASEFGAYGGDAPKPAVPDNWSVRLMWLNNGNGSKPSMYLYDQRRAKGRSGEHNVGDMTFTADRWYDVRIYVQLNKPGESDARTELWIDNRLMACRTGLMFRVTDAQKTAIQTLAFHNYYGGQAKNPAEFPDQPALMRFDNFQVTDGRATSFVPEAKDCSSEYKEQYLIPK